MSMMFYKGKGSSSMSMMSYKAKGAVVQKIIIFAYSNTAPKQSKGQLGTVELEGEMLRDSHSKRKEHQIFSPESQEGVSS